MGSIAGSDRTGERGEDAAAVMRAAPHTPGPVAAGAVLGTKRPSPEHRWQRPRAQVAAARHRRPSREQVPRWSSVSQVTWRERVWGGLSRRCPSVFFSVQPRRHLATLGRRCPSGRQPQTLCNRRPDVSIRGALPLALCAVTGKILCRLPRLGTFRKGFSSLSRVKSTFSLCVQDKPP